MVKCNLCGNVCDDYYTYNSIRCKCCNDKITRNICKSCRSDTDLFIDYMMVLHTLALCECCCRDNKIDVILDGR